MVGSPALGSARVARLTMMEHREDFGAANDRRRTGKAAAGALLPPCGYHRRERRRSLEDLSPLPGRQGTQGAILRMQLPHTPGTRPSLQSHCRVCLSWNCCSVAQSRRSNRRSPYPISSVARAEVRHMHPIDRLGQSAVRPLLPVATTYGRLAHGLAIGICCNRERWHAPVSSNAG